MTGASHIAERDIGRPVAPSGEPRAAEFTAALDRAHAPGIRLPRFVWMTEGAGAPGTGGAETKTGGDPRLARLEARGDSDHVFGWSWPPEAWRGRAARRGAAAAA